MLSSGQKMVIVLAVVSLGFAGYLVFPGMYITAQEQPEVFVTHSGAVVQTTGDVLDPVYTIQEVEFDPEKYLRNFDYGKVSQLEDGTTLREFTIIAEDDKIMELHLVYFIMFGHLTGKFLAQQFVQPRVI